MQYVALLRGINVGGKSLIKMADLKACFEAVGLRKVTTYIQSGNVLFETGDAPAKLTERIETALEKSFGYRLRVVLLSRPQLEAIIEEAPAGFGSQPDKYRYDAIFLKAPLTTAEALQGISPKEGVDQVAAGTQVIYFWRLIAKASQSRLNRIVGTPMYQNMTIRNWNTTTKLLGLLKAND